MVDIGEDCVEDFETEDETEACDMDEDCGPDKADGDGGRGDGKGGLSCIYIYIYIYQACRHGAAAGGYLGPFFT